MSRAAQRPALVTGAANGIGRAVALRLAGVGHPLALVDQDADGLASLVAGLSVPSCTVKVDLREEGASQRARKAAEAALGPIAILVNNAGIAPKLNGRGPGLLDTTDALWEQVHDINLRAMFRFCRDCVPGMRTRGWGRIVNISSLGGRTRSMIAGPSYMSSKAAVLGFTRAVASEFARDGITANCVAPGRIAGRLEAATDPEINAHYLRDIPVGRFGTADEVAALVQFLVGEDSGFITGAVVDTNGGYFMGG